MICPNCKHEYFTDISCPFCGLAEVEAFRKIAEECLSNELYALAAEYFGKVLRKVPSDPESIKKHAIALTRLAAEIPDAENLKKAETSLTEALNQDWGWDIGHQSRIQIADKEGKLDELVREYGSVVTLGEPGKVDMAKRVLQIIQLSQQFKAKPPVADSPWFSSRSVVDYAVIFSPFAIGLPIVAMATQAAVNAWSDKRPLGPYLFAAIIALFGSAILTFYSMSRVKRKRPSIHKELSL